MSLTQSLCIAGLNFLLGLGTGLFLKRFLERIPSLTMFYLGCLFLARISDAMAMALFGSNINIFDPLYTLTQDSGFALGVVLGFFGSGGGGWKRWRKRRSKELSALLDKIRDAVTPPVGSPQPA